MKHQIINILFVLISLWGWLFYSCDAPRHNPLDPENPDNSLVTLSGQVKTISSPILPLSDVTVFWKEGNILDQTDINGNYQIENISSNDGWLYFSKSGYLTDSIFVEWAKQKSQNFNIELNSTPQLDSLLIYSIIQNRYPNLQVLTLGVESSITDPDNDIDTIYIENPDLSFKNFLLFDPNLQMYKRIFSMSDLGITNAEAVIGHEFHIIVKDAYNHRIYLDKMSIKRIIKDQINLISPGSNEVVSSMPILNWEPLTPGYSLRYNIEIYNTDNLEAELKWSKQGISQSTSSIQVDKALAVSPNYFWVIWCIDEFNNRSRSRPKSFEVE
ncbi:MAG: carboxypeptidase-like regulatory domain-containing protein [Calditrichaceae bacterium]|nr:carboxypeptidase-like regulatory domain-containing protein [Calditrichaceae bacterium]